MATSDEILTTEYVYLITELQKLNATIQIYPDAEDFEFRWSITIFTSNTEPKTVFGNTFLETGWKAIGAKTNE